MMIELLDSSDDDEQAAPAPEPRPGPELEPEVSADLDLDPAPTSSSDRRSSNPFAAFAFEDAAGAGDAPPPPPPPATKRPAPAPVAAPASNHHQAKRRARPAASSSSTATGKRHECGPPEDFDALRAEEREAVYRKWTSIVNMAKGAGPKLIPSASAAPPPAAAVDDDEEETRRFRTLVAVIMSSRTQESMVRQAMQRIAAMPGGFTVGTLAAIDPADTSHLHERISYIHCNKVKSKHIVQSARRIRDELGGAVPRTLEGLLTMAGIGPTLAPLLVFLFKYREQKQQQEMQQKAGKEEAQQGDVDGKEGADTENKAPAVEVVVLDDTPQKPAGPLVEEVAAEKA